MKKAFAALLMGVSLLAQDYLVEGNPASTVRVIAYEDLQCPDCAVYRKMMDEKLLPKYSGKVAFEHRDFPLPKHDWARDAAVAARYFDGVKPELGVEFRRFCYSNQAVLSAASFRAKLQAFAKDKGADPSSAVASLADKKLKAAVDQDYKEAIARGVARTPTIFVNGEPFIETFTLEAISNAIDKALGTFKP